MQTTQDLVYGDLGKPMVTAAFDGFNGTVFAYGQTGSGKSWSMMGAQEKAAPELDGECGVAAERAPAAPSSPRLLP